MNTRLEYLTDTVRYSELEQRICEHCGIDYIDSSSTPTAFPIGKSVNITLHMLHEKPNKHISCSVIVYKQSDNTYLVYVSSIRFI